MQQTISKKELLDNLMSSSNPYITPKKLCEKHNFLKTQTLAKMRSDKKGPPFVKFGTGVLYIEKNFHKWLLDSMEGGDYKIIE